MRVDLILLGKPDRQPFWSLGSTYIVKPTPFGIAALVDQWCGRSNADAWLFWDPAIALPDSPLIERLLTTTGDLWHAGLRLGMSGLPGSIDFVAPSWMFNRDPSPEIEATSWRVSLRACLVRTSVLQQIGCVLPQFQTLEGAALELGHRYLMRGIIPRHVPSLIATEVAPSTIAITFDDELRFIYYRFGKRWGLWSMFRAVSTHYASVRSVLGAARVLRTLRPPETGHYVRPRTPATEVQELLRVTVLIPTLDRYEYLRVLLGQLRTLSVKPFEIIVIDQTPAERRDSSIAPDFADLPLRVLYQETTGQCTARNAGLSLARGDYVLFLDDDDEIDSFLIAKHLQTIQAFRAEVSCGIAIEDGIVPLPDESRYVRASDVFPTGNAMIRRDVLSDSGLFDLAYDNGRNEDGDLGMRMYLSGKVMIMNPDISVLHHHAPRGGLRTRNQRVVTYASSRRKLLHRNLLSVSEIYLQMRYFSSTQLREMLWLCLLGTFSVWKGNFRRAIKVSLSLIYLPHSLFKIRANARIARQMLNFFPKIPKFRHSVDSLK